MGIGASTTNVRHITIDQNDQKWDKYNARSRRNKTPLNWRKLVGVRDKPSSNAEESRLRAALECCQKQFGEAEARIRTLERQLATLDMRNAELIEEIRWLRQQITENPEVPKPERPSTANSRPATSAGKAMEKHLEVIHDLQEQIRRYQTEIALMKAQHKKEVSELQDRLLMGERESKYVADEKVVEQLESEIEKQMRTIERMHADILDRDAEIRSLKEVLSNRNQPIAASNGAVAAGDTAMVTANKYLKPKLVAAQQAHSSDQPLSQGNRRAHLDSRLQNVFTLNEHMEPVKVLETPYATVINFRPSTAASARSDASAMLPGAADDSAALSRGHSAPMLFKPRQYQKTTSTQRSNVDNNIDNVMTDIEDQNQSVAALDNIVMLSPKRTSRMPSGSHADDDELAAVGDDSSDDEEIRRLFYELNTSSPTALTQQQQQHKQLQQQNSRTSSSSRLHSAAPPKNVSSAKSRDSGFLGDSIHSQMSLQWSVDQQ